MFLAAARKLAAGPAQCAVMEDAVNGVAAAKAAGMRCMAVAQTFPADALAGADLVRERIGLVRIADLRGG